jgi:hypothetical protein
MTIIDRHARFDDSPEFSAKSIDPITPNDDADLAFVTKALYVNATGTLSLIAQEDAAAVSLNVFAGQVLPIRAKRVRATGTTATVIAMY